MRNYGKSIYNKVRFVHKLAPELSYGELLEICKMGDKEYDKWVESKGGFVARMHKENPILKGAEHRSSYLDYLTKTKHEI